jgi:hypothetical protein
MEIVFIFEKYMKTLSKSKLHCSISLFVKKLHIFSRLKGRLISTVDAIVEKVDPVILL